MFGGFYVLCVCLQQHVRRQILKDFESVNPFQKRNGEQQLVENVVGGSVAEQSEQQRRRESEMKNRRMEETKRGETNAANLDRGSRRNEVRNENPDCATHPKLPAKGQDACR